MSFVFEVPRDDDVEKCVGLMLAKMSQPAPMQPNKETLKRLLSVESSVTIVAKKQSKYTDQVALHSRKGFVVEGLAKEYVMGRNMLFLRN